MTTLMKSNNGLSILPELPLVFNERLFKNWFNWSNESGNTEESSTLPAINIREMDHAFEISVAAPGMTKNDFKVELDNNRLIISGERKQDNEQTTGNYLRKEFSYQSFTRTFTLAENQVNGENIEAKYFDGILHITIPKSDEAKTQPVKIIHIS